MGWTLWLQLVSPLLVAVGILVGVLRWSHRTAHHWHQVWTLPEKVATLAENVQKHTDEMGELRQTIRDRFPPLSRERRPPTWPRTGT